MTKLFVVKQQVAKPDKSDIVEHPTGPALRQLEIMGVGTARLVFVDDDENLFRVACSHIVPRDFQGPVILDYTRNAWKLSVQPKVDAAVNDHLRILKIAKEEMPHARIGFLGVPDALSDSLSENQAIISRYAHLLEACGAIFPLFQPMEPVIHSVDCDDDDAVYTWRSYPQRLAKLCATIEGPKCYPAFVGRYDDPGTDWDMCVVNPVEMVALARIVAGELPNPELEGSTEYTSGAILLSADLYYFESLAMQEDFEPDHEFFMTQMRAKCLLTGSGIPVVPQIHQIPEEMKAQVIPQIHAKRRAYMDALMFSNLVILDIAFNGRTWPMNINAQGPSFKFEPRPKPVEEPPADGPDLKLAVDEASPESAAAEAEANVEAMFPSKPNQDQGDPELTPGDQDAAAPAEAGTN